MGSTFKTREEAEACYDAQIKALLAEDYKAWAAVSEHVARDGEVPYSHWTAWGHTGEKSLFARLPNSDYCATQIETSQITAGENLALRNTVLKDSNCKLPDVGSTTKFTEAELNEIKRRQLLLRFPPVIENKTVE